MKKGLGKIRKIKKKHIFLALLAVIVLGGLAKAYSAWVGTTRIAFLNYQAIALGQISHANDNAMIKLSEITTDDFDHLDDYDMIIVNGMGLRIDENQRKQLEEASYKVPTLTHAATNPANNIVSVDNFDADYLMQYIENGSKKNYHNMLAYIRKFIDGKKFMAPEPDRVDERPNYLLTHFDPEDEKGDELGFNSIREYNAFLAKNGLYKKGLKINQRMEVYKAKRHVQVLIHELQEKEEQIDQPVFLTRGDHIGMISRMLLLDLKHAIKNKELYMLYQPQVYSDGICIGAEALLRWNHPVYGMIYPPLIIYLAEAGKVLPELERFIIDEVTDGIVQTRAQYDSDFKISVNITAHSLLWDIEGYIRQTMEQKEIDAHMLWIEITEQDILLQTDMVVRKLEELKKQGHKLLIDDFGMGHTSLLYLQSEYFDVVKLDGSLTRPLLKSHTNQKIVRSIIELGQELGVKVIAEFVENREQRDLLDTLGCHCYQGYLYAKPLELEAFITYMKQMNEK